MNAFSMTTMCVIRIQGKQEVIDVYSEESEVYKDKNYQQKQKVGRSLCISNTAAIVWHNSLKSFIFCRSCLSFLISVLSDLSFVSVMSHLT